jgi:cyclase
VIPVLKIDKKKQVITENFKDLEIKIGSPINTVRIWSDMSPDEIVVLDITATVEERSPDVEYLRRLSKGVFVPMAYGGGIRSVEEAVEIIQSGYEKVILNTCSTKEMVSEIADTLGSQSVTASIDHIKEQAFICSGKTPIYGGVVNIAKMLESFGVGEILVNSIERDGSWSGYDMETLIKVSDSVRIPVTVLGGAGSIDDISKALTTTSATGAAAGTMFTFAGKGQGVCVNYKRC